jgi:hypothetical protein
MKTGRWVLALASILAAFGSVGCTTGAFCFADCGDDGGVAEAQPDAAPDAPADNVFVDTGSECGLFGCKDAPSDQTSDCTPTNGGIEICDGVDNDCDGLIDEDESDGGNDAGINYHSPATCGGCGSDGAAGVNCEKQIQCAEAAVCTGSFTCDYTTCSQDCYDLDGDRTNGCEYFCIKKTINGQPVTDETDPSLVCNGLDDDCDGQIDEDANLCNDVNNCGKCGRTCSAPNADPICVHDADAGATCTDTDTKCTFKCKDGFADLNNSMADGCEYQCPVWPPTQEICDNIDNDCDGKIDQADPDIANAPGEGDVCFGGTLGVCAAQAHAGNQHCQSGAFVCQGANVVKPGTQIETCNAADDDCDGIVDGTLDGSTIVTCSTDADCATQPFAKVCRSRPANGDSVCAKPTDASNNGEGTSCGSSVGECTPGVQKCQSGSLQCVGGVTPQPEVCNGRDDDCNNQIDDNPTDVGTPCNVPPAPPAGATEPCKAGAFACVAGTKVCQGSVTAQQNFDSCGVDSNCDGVYNGPTPAELQTDVKNCGACGNDCTAKGGHVNWTCQGGACVPIGCQSGFYDCDANKNDCERPCTFVSAVEQCNGIDDNCDCNVDELKDAQHPNGIVAPSTNQVCGVGAGAANPGPCTTQATVACVAGAWKCTFPSGYCAVGDPSTCADDTGPGSDVCDGLDNNCNGTVDEFFKHPLLANGALGDPCASDDASPGTQGVCRKTGTYVCNGTTSTKCSAQTAYACTDTTNPNNPSGSCTELCDGLDNDCDGSTDEPKSAPGSNATYYVSPAVVKTRNSPALWMYAYEASRPSASSTTSGTGNGYFTSAPSGVTLDKTPACSAPNRIPWFNVTGAEAKQVCTAAGGRLCREAEWERGCRIDNAVGGTPATSNACSWGYAPRAQCSTSHFTTTGDCNLGAFDFDTSASGTQNGLLPTAYAGGLPAPNPPGINGTCFADWSAYNSNPSGSDKLYDVTGNLREETVCLERGAPCTSSADCCLYNGAQMTCTNGYCVPSGGACRAVGIACTAGSQCCDATGCTTGYCGGCRAVGTACTANTDCCDGNCANGYCGGMSGTPGEVYPLMGGSFNTQDENGAKCDFSFYTVDQGFELFDVGFRCCFDSDPE